MDLLKLSKQERFYFDVGEGIAMYNTRCLIDRNTLEVILYAPVDGDWDIELDEDGEEIEAEDKYSDPDKYMVIEPVIESFT